jgi:hypothetical protein
MAIFRADPFGIYQLYLTASSGTCANAIEILKIERKSNAFFMSVFLIQNEKVKSKK